MVVFNKSAANEAFDANICEHNTQTNIWSRALSTRFEVLAAEIDID